MAKKPAAVAAPSDNVTPADVPLLPWESSPPAALNIDSLLEVDSDEEHPDESEPEADTSAEPDDDEDVEDDDPDESEESEEEDDDEPAPAEPDVIDLGDEKVTREELKKRGLREADYTRKTQELAAKRKEIEAEAETLRHTREQYAQNLQALLDAMQADEPDWDKLRMELTPEEFAQTFAEHELAAKKRQKVQAARDKALQEQQDANEKRWKEWVDEQAVLLMKAVPEWQDKAKANEEQQAIVNYAKQTFGMTDQELAHLYDHRIIVALRKAMKYDALQSGKEKLREKAKAAPVLKPGAPAPPMAKEKSAMKQARQRLAQSGSVHDAAALIAQQLGDD